jgi:HEAT repeat protein
LISKKILEQLENKNWATRKQAIRILTKLSEQGLVYLFKLNSLPDICAEVFQELMKTSGVIPKVIVMLKDDDDDVRAAVVKALSTFGEQRSSYLIHFHSCLSEHPISCIFRDDEKWKGSSSTYHHAHR